MRRVLLGLLLIAALCVPWATQAQVNYTFATGVDSTMWITLSSSATQVGYAYDDDENSSVINIGFPFQVGLSTYTQFSVNSNDVIGFGPTAINTYWGNPFTSTYANNASSYGAVYPFVTAHGMDNAIGANGYIKYELTGTSPNRVMVIEYYTNSEYDDSQNASIRYQVQLHEDSSRIRIIYGTSTASYYDGYQAGIATASNENWTVNTTAHTMTAGTSAVSTTYSSWPGANRYYDFVPPVITCPQPFDLVVDASQTEATLSWTAGGSESSWEVLFNDSISTIVTDTFHTEYNLTANTNYTFAVRAICGDGDSSFWVTYSFATPCDYIDSIPYIYDFEDASTGSSSNTNFVSCWNRLTDGTSTYCNYPYVSSSSTYNHTTGGTKGLYWYNSTTTSYGSYHCIVLPGVDIDNNPINTLQLKFWSRASSASYAPEFKVGVMTDPTNISTFTEVATINVEGTTWTEYEAFLSTYEGTGRYVAICAYLGNSYWYAYVDDITLDLMPSCPHVNSVAVDSVGSDFVDISWVAAGDETEWLIYLNDSIIGTSTDTTYSITGLNLNTVYNIGVAALCSSTDTSSIVSVSARTLAGEPISTFPYVCGFDTEASRADWVLENGTQTNQWWIDTASLYISNDSGANNSYTASSTSYVFAYITLSLDAASYNYSYDWRAYGESCCDFIRAAIVPNTVEFTAGSYCGFNSTSGVPTGGIAIDGEYRLNLSSSWTTQAGEFYIPTAGQYKMVFMWRNDGSVGTMPPAAIDNVMLSLVTCPTPRNLTAEYVSGDSITVSWEAGADETSWVVSNGVDTVAVYDTTYTFEQLTPNTPYVITVLADCGSDDSSRAISITVRTACAKVSQFPMVEDFENQTTGSSSNSTFIPCWNRLTDATSSYGNYPYVSGSSTYNHTDGGTKGLYWYRSTTASYGNYHTVVLPEVDTSVAPLNTLMLTFWSRPSSTSYSPVLYVGTMTDGTADSTFTPYDTINIDNSSTDWQKYTVRFDQCTASGSFIAIRDTLLGSYWYAYVDDITLDLIPACSPIENLVVNPGTTSAFLTWDAVDSNYNGALVEYKDTAATSWTSVSVTNTYAPITSLTAGTLYDVRVSSICGEVTASPISAQFSTRSFNCSQFDTTNMINLVLDNGTSTSSYLPSYSFYNYGYSQQFVKASELGDSAVLTRISIYPTAVNQQRTYEIYFGYSSDTSALSFINPSQLTCVYNGGPIAMTANQWLDFDLTNPFNYHASLGNLVVIFRDMTGTYVSGNAFRTHTAWDGAARYIYQDASPYTPGNVSNGTSVSVRNDMKIFGGTCLQTSTCAAPPASVVAVSPTTIDVAWAPGNTETAWNLYYALSGTDTYTAAAMGVTTTSYQFTGLTGGMNYDLLIVPVCSDSMATELHATTECAKISSLPFTETFNTWGVGTTARPNCWNRNGSYSSYPYISGSFNHAATTGGALYMYQASSAANSSRIIMPELDTTVYAVNQTQLVFYSYRSSASYNPYYEIGVTYNPEDAYSFIPVDTVQHTADAGTWQIHEVPLNNFADSGAYITIKTCYISSYSYSYIDDVTLEVIPTCPRPDSLTASNATSNSVDFGWHERGSATNWIIEYGPMGFTLGTGTTVAANSNPFTLSNMPAAYQGEYYVRSVCSSTDTGEYSRTACAFSTSQIPATLPYDYNFEDATEWANWQTSTNTTTNWYRGNAVADSGSYSMYISADTGNTYSPYQHISVVNAAAFRDIDFGTIDSSYTLSFSARVGGTLSASYDGLMVFLVDPALPTVASNSNITTPWGNVNDLYRIAAVRLDTVWDTYTASFDTISGVHRVAFFWFNQNTQSGYPNLGEPAAVDNIHIDYSSCPRPINLTATPGSTTALLSWQGASNANYEVTYRATDGGTNQVVYTNTNSVTVTGLDIITQYAFWVRKICSVGDTSLYSDGELFMTNLCDGATNAYNYDSTMNSTTSSYSPIGYATYNYSYVQTIIDSAYMAELGGDITAFSFKPNSTTSSTYFTNMTVYMANVSETDLTAGFILPDSTHSFVKVIDSANFNFSTTDEQFHLFDTAFTWDGHSNVLFAVNREHGQWSSSPSFAAHTASTAKMRYVYNDNSAYDITTVSGGYSSTSVGDIHLISCGAGCPVPTATVASYDYAQATISWNGSAETYEYAYKAAADATWPEETTTTQYTQTITGLLPATAYQFRVRAVCDTESVSEWAIVSFVTDSLPCFAPSNVEADAQGQQAVISWTAGGNETEWTIHVFNTTFDQEYTTTTNPYTVTGLTANVTYNVAVSANCGGGLLQSDWSDTISFTTVPCDPVTNVTASNVTGTTANITWTAGDNNTGNWEISWNYQGAGMTNLLGTATVTSATYDITGLTANTPYEVFVRAICAEGYTSDYATTTFTTQNVGIARVEEGMSLSIFPNPATGNTTVTLSGVNGNVTISVIDMSGRTVQTSTMECDGDCEKSISVDNLAAGAYFVRVYGDNVNTVKKLIVK
ncbi:MAG: fibronectin type III domain-containing protein [Bacteroidales bacterium]|nr:fibronectin type III domain-containing protein [Bacteroidales bacterium]